MGCADGREASQELILACKEGKQQAWRELYDLYRADVYRLACAIRGDRDEAEDLTQEVFVKALRSLNGFEGDGVRLRAWFRRVTINTCISDARSRRRSTVSYGDARGAGSDGGQVGRRSVALGVLLRKALGSLAVELRETIILHDVCGYKHREIAEIMSVEEATSRTRLAKARMNLRQELAPYLRLLSDQGS